FVYAGIIACSPTRICLDDIQAKSQPEPTSTGNPPSLQFVIRFLLRTPPFFPILSPKTGVWAVKMNDGILTLKEVADDLKHAAKDTYHLAVEGKYQGCKISCS